MSELVVTYELDDPVTGAFSSDRIEAFRKAGSRHPEPWHFGLEASRLSMFLGQRGLTFLDDAGAEQHSARYLRPAARELFVSDIERIARAGV